MEYALPAEAAGEVAKELQRVFREESPQVYFPVEFRRVAADDIWLSPFYERESVTFAVHQYHKQPYAEFFAACETIFRAHGGRPHWGKLHTRNAEELADLYPRWSDFHRLRRELDPKGIFMNDYLRQLFGEAEAVPA
jgi:FAD/FMN-containing dehydrogenase